MAQQAAVCTILTGLTVSRCTADQGAQQWSRLVSMLLDTPEDCDDVRPQVAAIQQQVSYLYQPSNSAGAAQATAAEQAARQALAEAVGIGGAQPAGAAALRPAPVGGGPAGDVSGTDASAPQQENDQVMGRGDGYAINMEDEEEEVGDVQAPGCSGAVGPAASSLGPTSSDTRPLILFGLQGMDMVCDVHGR